MSRCLVFDLDGTLVDSVPDIAAALNRIMLARDLPPFTLPAAAAMVGDGVRVLLDRAFAARGCHPDADADGDFMAAYAAHVADGTLPYPGIETLLEQAQAAGWRLAICTNKPQALAHGVLAAIGIADKFAAVGGGDSFAVRKPDPAHLHATLAAAGATAARAVMVGDHHNDVLAATGAGVPCIFAQWGYGAPGMEQGAAAVATSAADVLALAERLCPAHSPTSQNPA